MNDYQWYSAYRDKIRLQYSCHAAKTSNSPVHDQETIRSMVRICMQSLSN